MGLRMPELPSPRPIREIGRTPEGKSVSLSSAFAAWLDQVRAKIDSSIVMRGEFVDGQTYSRNEMATSQGVSAIANTQTTESPAISYIASPALLYQGASPVSVVAQSQWVSIQRYTVPDGKHYSLTGGRVYTTAGDWCAISVVDSSLTPVKSFAADTTGWHEFSIGRRIMSGSFDLVFEMSTASPNITYVSDANYWTDPNVTCGSGVDYDAAVAALNKTQGSVDMLIGEVGISADWDYLPL